MIGSRDSIIINETKKRAIQFEVTDTGCGLTEDVKKTLFQQFSTMKQFNDDTDLFKIFAKNQGIGLGLSIAKT